MKIQTDAPLANLNRDGNLKKDNLTDAWGRVTGPDPDSPDFLVRDAVAEALFQKVDGEKVTGSSELRKYRLANLFVDNDVLDFPGELKKEDRTYILARSPKLGPLVHGRLYDALHPEDSAGDDDTEDEDDDA